jgi:hypothetical protein
MRYEETRRLRGIEGAWLRLKLWLRPAFPRNDATISDLSHLSDHERRDIGLPDQVRYMDWRALKDQK